MTIMHLKNRLIGGLLATLCMTTVQAGAPSWTFTPLTATTVSIPSDDIAIVQYRVTNQSRKIHTLKMQSIPAITQVTTGLNVCSNPFVLVGGASCTLSLQVNGSQLAQRISGGPDVCEQGSTLQCYRPALRNILHITQAPPISYATITVTNSPLTLTANGSTGTLTINNMSLTIAATNIQSNFTGTALDGNVTETGNMCANLLPLGTCTLTYTPGSTVVSQTDFPIQGTNTNAVTAAIEVDSGVTLSNVNPSSGAASGGTGVTLTGTGLTGATGITFGGTAATSVHVVSSTTVTAITPAHATGAVDVVITTPSGSATETNGYTYLTTTVGQSAYGGTIACLNSGGNNLIAATADNSAGIEWGGSGIVTGANSNSDGATNTSAIVLALGNNGGTPYAAQLCENYAIDSQGNAPCEAGNACYDDWFLPAGFNMGLSGQLNCLYTHRAAIGGFDSSTYWGSIENGGISAWGQDFSGGSDVVANKGTFYRVRCVRSFTP